MNATELSTFNFLQRNAVEDRATLAARLEAYREKTPAQSTALILPNPDDQLTDMTLNQTPGVAEISAAEFSTDTLRNAMMTSGSLIVRGLFNCATAAPLSLMIDEVLEACAQDATKAAADATAPAATSPSAAHFNPPANLADIMPRGMRELGNTRQFHRDSGSAMCVEAPRVAEALLQWYEDLGLKQILAEYLGEPPCLSAKKWVLRRSRLPVAEAGWHQDGAFMGTDINSLNMWLPLNTCGGDSGAPGLDVLPHRLLSIASAEGAQFDWSVSASQVSEAGQNTVFSPVFEAGDAMFFDHFFLHRTQYGRDFTLPRYAIETWFFGASRFPKNQIPLAW